MFISILIGILLLAPPTIYLAFFALCTVKRLKKAGIKLTPVMKVASLATFVVGGIADILMNLIHARFWFGEWRGLTFSDRIQYYHRHPGKCPNRAEFEYWFKVLETGDPGHAT